MKSRIEFPGTSSGCMPMQDPTHCHGLCEFWSGSFMTTQS
ncbi:hypothetical protein OIU77_018611 [Salix suchowensis]|uniref:Uncharacterized protein n=1 Tax=Salix suchowensis TaxID=1278906 RepID=A0ABQ9CGJ1_9ROSI|nr:hypothetical protein OIU77_018611 [Salix suchowensis]